MPGSELVVRRSMPAGQEVVFGVASDPALLHRWVPPLAGQVDAPELDTDPAACRASWAEGGYSGRLDVQDAGAGTSTVVLRLSFPDDPPEGAEDVARSALDQLAGEVTTRVNDAS
jgi:hypothetical protein